ncbi:MAG: hypothetical protein Q9164_001411 [Protoblastenia rupestris]
MHRLSSTIAVLGALIAITSAVPHPVPAPNPVAAPEPQVTTGARFEDGRCIELKDNYTITSQEKFLAKPRLVTGATCQALGDLPCQIADGKIYAVSVTVNVGGDFNLNLGSIVTAGVDAGVSLGTTKSESVTTTVQCPPGCNCGLQAVAHMYHIEGIHNENVAYPYNVDVPITIAGAAENNQARVDYSACRVGGTFCGKWGPNPVLPLCPGITND